jgi:hypothetical protein
MQNTNSALQMMPVKANYFLGFHAVILHLGFADFFLGTTLPLPLRQSTNSSIIVKAEFLPQMLTANLKVNP